MFKTQKPAMAPSYHDDTSSVRSGRTNNSFTRLFQRSDSSKKFTSNNAIKVAPPGSVNTANLYSSHHSRNGSISSNPITSPVSPTMQFHGNDFAPRGGPLGTLSEEIQSYQEYQQFQAKPQSQELELQYPTPGMEDYRQCLHWLQQTCRPMFMKDLTQHLSVPVPITPANAKKPEQIGGTQDVQVAALKNVQVQIMPLERWGKPQEVLAELQALHSVRRCKQVIQLFGYLPNANVPSGQSPALILQQPSNGSLRQFLSHNFESIQWPDRYKIALDMARGLRFLAEEGIPCTMNSGNILIDADGVAVLTGFGSPGGMIVSAPCQMTTQPSGPSLIVYMAPERIMGLGTYSLEWSLYSLGVLLWELSSGHMPFEEILARAESGPRFAKTMEQLSSAIVKGLREETVPGTPDIYEQLYRMCWSGETESRPPLEVVEETLQMLVVVEPIDMILPGEEMSMPISSVVSESIDGDALSAHTPTRTNSVRSESPGPGHHRNGGGPGSVTSAPPMPGGHSKVGTLHEAVSVSNADMTEWYVLAGHDLNGYMIVPTFSLECEITPIQTCLSHYLPTSLGIFKELMEQDVDVKLLAKRSLQNCLHILLDRYIPFKNDKGSFHLFFALDKLLEAGVEVNALDSHGHTPLHLLMRNPRMSSDDVAECLRRMVAKGADTSIHSPKDGNVLALACKYLHFEAAKYILSHDILASEPESIDRAIEACMTMTGRATDSFVNLRGKTRELLKVWTGKAGTPRREKLALKLLQDAGQVDNSGIRVAKGKVIKLVPPAQLQCANEFYDKNVKKKRERLYDTMGVLPMGVMS